MEEEIKHIIKKRGGLLLSEEIGSYYDPLSIKCVRGHIFELIPADLVERQWCPSCQRSEGLDMLYILMNQTGIEYKKQVSFPFAPKLFYDVHLFKGFHNLVIDFDERSLREENPTATTSIELRKKRHIVNVKTRLALENKIKIIRLCKLSLPETGEGLAKLINDFLGVEDEYLYLPPEEYDWINSKDDIRDLEKLEDRELDYEATTLEKIPQLSHYIEGDSNIPQGFPSIVGYCRVSTLMQAREGHSLEMQMERIKTYATYKNLPIRRIYQDAGISGKELTSRPGLMALLNELIPKTYVVVLSLSRLARNVKQAIEIDEIIKRKHCYLVALDVDINTNTAVGRLIFNVLNSINQFERENTVEKIKLTMENMKGQQKLRSRPPFGYRFVGKGRPFEIEPKEQNTIQRIKELILQNPLISLLDIARDLEMNEGYLNLSKRDSKKWYPQMIKNIIINNQIPYMGCSKQNQGE